MDSHYYGDESFDWEGINTAKEAKEKVVEVIDYPVTVESVYEFRGSK